MLVCRPLFPAMRWTMRDIFKSYLEFFGYEYTEGLSLFDHPTG